jgi:alkylation response protein AidB-like acyl-CoA dehydrogenase
VGPALQRAGAGSDLAGLTTRAERDGDRWIITGQKVWSSQARRCDYGMLLARTSFDVPKHKGISWFAFRLDQPGVTIRPLREMTGDDIFNEIFLDEAVVDDADLIGGEGNGWMVTQATLHYERTGIGAGGGMAGFPFPGPKGGMLGRRAGDAALEQPRDTKLTLGFEDVVELARRLGRTCEPHVRQELSTLYTDTTTGLWNAQRGKAEARSGGGQALGSIAKLTQTRIVKQAAQVASLISGAHSTLAGPDGIDGGAYSKAMVFSPASSIYGGTDEIQRNIVAERTLGLPREPTPDKNRAYGEILRGV